MKGSFNSAIQFGSLFLKKNVISCKYLHHGACMQQKSQQGIQPSKLPLSPLNCLCGLVVFIDMNFTCIYLQKEAGVSKYYLFTKKMLSMELDMILIVLMETLDFPEIYSRFD